MTEKVKVTREQAEAIERIKTEQIKRFEEVKKNKTAYLLTDWEKPLFELESKHLQDALYIGYEVKPEFKVGDWVKANWRLEKPTIHKLKGIDRNTVEIDGEQNNTNPGISIISLATPKEIAEEKERRWWAKHGREVWELKKGDLLFCNHGGRVHRVMQPNLNKPAQDETRLSDGLWVTDDELKRNWKVACFIKDRLDVKTND